MLCGGASDRFLSRKLAGAKAAVRHLTDTHSGASLPDFNPHTRGKTLLFWTALGGTWPDEIGGFDFRRSARTSARHSWLRGTLGFSNFDFRLPWCRPQGRRYSANFDFRRSGGFYPAIRALQ
jgi:hypothetical protein